jgi:hypothetical protein
MFRIASAGNLLENKGMRMRQTIVACGVVVAAFWIAFSPVVSAQPQEATSPGYKVDQIFMGTGGELNACSSGSTGYCAKQSAGEIAAGHAAGTLFSTRAGFNTDREPYIAMSVATSGQDLGTLSTAATATTTATFAIKTYLAHGYVVRLASDPPTAANHTLAAPSTPQSPAIGTEQFGINLVANNSPITFGDPPVQVPDNTFSFGTVATDYATPDFYKYVKGDVIAESNRSSGQTDYTISFIYNISNLTPNGEYVFNGELVAVSTY